MPVHTSTRYNMALVKKMAITAGVTAVTLALVKDTVGLGGALSGASTTTSLLTIGAVSAVGCYISETYVQSELANFSM